MNILLTGSDGFIGSNLFYQLKEEHNVIGFDIKNKVAHKILEPKIVNKSRKKFSNINIKVKDIKSVISLKKFTKKIVPIPLSSI